MLCCTDSIGSAFTFDFRNSSRIKRPFNLGLAKSNRSAEMSPEEFNGSRASELQVQLQSQQEDLNRMQEVQSRLQEELMSQKVLRAKKIKYKMYCIALRTGSE